MVSIAPAKTKKSQVGPAENTPQKSAPITVGEERKYAGATWRDMALYTKLTAARDLGNLPPHMRKNVTVGDLMGDDFARVMAHKTAHHLQHNPIEDPEGAMLIKSAAPWLMKADELNATNITNQGLEWVGTTYDEDLWARARHETELFNLLESRGMRIKDVDPGTNKVTFGIDTGSGTVYTRGEANSVDATGRPEVTVGVNPFTTDSVTMTAAEHAIALMPTSYLTEDTFVDTMRFIDNDMMQTLMESLESTLINGDTETAANTNVNLIDGTPATGLQKPDYIAWNGMRKYALVTYAATQSRTAGGSLAITDYINTRKLFNSTIRNRKGNMVTIIDFDTEVATRKLVQVLTSDVAGGPQLATMYTGELAPALDGVPVYVSGQLALSNSAGKIPAAGGTLGSIITAYAPYIAYGRKREVEIKQQDDILSGTTIFVASIRHTSIHRGADGAVMTYNVGV